MRVVKWYFQIPYYFYIYQEELPFSPFIYITKDLQILTVQITVLCYHLFFCSNSQIWCVGDLHVGPCVLLTSPHHFFSTSLVSGTRGSRLFFYFACSHLESVILPFFSLENGHFKTKTQLKFSHCYSDIHLVNKVENVYMSTHTYHSRNTHQFSFSSLKFKSK